MEEFTKTDDGIRLAYERLGAGPPVLLIHGFGSSREQNWKSTGWYASLTESGREVVAMDCRGHGHSDKPHDPAMYGHDRMARDAIAVLDAADLPECDVVGYSMGGYIALRAAAAHAARVRRLVLAGVGERYFAGGVSSEGSRGLLADALLTDDKSAITDAKALMFRNFADQPGKDRLALAACMRGMSPPLPRETLAQLQQKVLIVCGELDDISGPPAPLAAAFPHGVFAAIAGRDHMSAVGDRRTRSRVIEFLEL